MFGLVLFGTDQAQAFYYKESTTKFMPVETVRESAPKEARYAISPKNLYVRTIPMYRPVQYEIMAIEESLLVRIPSSRESSAAYGGGDASYWPAWIGLPGWMY